MEVKFLKNEENEAELVLDNLTIAEILRAYLNKDENVSFVAWKREHPTKKEISLKIKTKGKSVKKALQDTISKIEKRVDNLVSDFKKSK